MGGAHSDVGGAHPQNSACVSVCGVGWGGGCCLLIAPCTFVCVCVCVCVCVSVGVGGWVGVSVGGGGGVVCWLHLVHLHLAHLCGVCVGASVCVCVFVCVC